MHFIVSVNANVMCCCCQTCPGRCEEDKPCVLCRAFQSGDLSEEYCDANCTHIEIVDSVEGEWIYPRHGVLPFRV